MQEGRLKLNSVNPAQIPDNTEFDNRFYFLTIFLLVISLSLALIFSK